MGGHNSHSAFTSIKVVLYWFRFLGDEAVNRVLYHLHGGRYGTGRTATWSLSALTSCR